MSIRQCGKKSNHGLNYDMKYRRFALVNEIEESEAKRVVDLYKKRAYPGLKVWHESIVTELREGRTLTNCFGRRRRFMDAWGPELFDAAYSFKPQSTVFDVCRIGMVRTYNSTEPLCEPAQLMMHVHDSNVYQYPTVDLLSLSEFCELVADDYMSPKCEYNGREFWIDTTMKMGYDVGYMLEFEPTLESVHKTLEKLDEKASA
jgi:DNA polymerase I-like protein with 3'-5' exonuclease and polymerase domains